MQSDFCRFALMTLLLTGTIAHGRDIPIEGAVQPDIYDALRRSCSTTGEDEWKRCQLSDDRKGEASRNSCSEARERERRKCMLQVMLRQNRDIQGLTEPATQ